MHLSRRLITAAVAAVALGLIGGPATAGAATRSCKEDDRFIQEVRATNLKCKTAVEIAFAHARKSACFRGEGESIGDRATPCTVRRYRCTPTRAEGGIIVRCKRDDRRVRFFNSGG